MWSNVCFYLGRNRYILAILTRLSELGLTAFGLHKIWSMQCGPVFARPTGISTIWSFRSNTTLDTAAHARKRFKLVEKS